MKTVYRLIIVVAVLAAVGFGVWWYMSPETQRVAMTPARIENVKQMVRLSTLELYEEVPVKGHVGTRHLVARLALEGTVEFDLDRLRMEERGDTVTVVLPPEIVTLRESTRPGSYAVIDTWNDELFRSGNITAREENRMKELTVAAAKRNVYAKGYVKQARAAAVESVRSLLTAACPGKTVIVVDPTPQGSVGV